MGNVYYCGSPHKKKKSNKSIGRFLFSFIVTALFMVGFTTQSYAQYCVPSATTSTKYINDFSTSGAIGDISNMGSGFSTGGYGDFTSDTLYVIPGGATVNFTENFMGGTSGFRIWIDAGNDDDFTGDVVYNSNSYSSTQTGSFTTPTAVGTYRMRIACHYLSTTGDVDPCETGFTNGEFEDYTVKVFTPSCMPVSALTLDNLAANNDLDISWTQGASETTWNISWGPSGYTPGDANEIGNETGWTTGTNYTVTGLTSDTDYDVYVQADCGGGDESIWSGPLNIYTGYCEPTNSYSTSYYIQSVSTSGAILNLNNTGTGFGANGYSDYRATDTLIVYPGQDIEFTFEHPSSTYSYSVWVDWDNNFDFSDPNDAIIANGTSYQATPYTVSYTVPSAAPLTTTTLRVRNAYLSAPAPACGDFNYGEAEDYIIKIVAPPTCLKPIDLLVAPVYGDSATVSWTPVNGEGSWTIVWGPPGFTPGDANQIGSATSTDEFYTMTGLTGGTDYDVYVQGDCGGGDESAWGGPYTFSDTYCEPQATTSTTYYIDDVTTTGALTNLNNVNSGLSTGGYGDFTGADTLVVYPGQTVDFSIVSGYSTQKYFVWVDWFQNANFDDANELIESTTAYSSDHAFSYTIPVSIPLMTTRLRVRARGSGSGTLDPCEYNNYTETEDYILKIIAAPSCLPPINLDSLNATTTEVEIGWDEQNSATAWTIEYGPTGFTPGTGTIVSNVNTNPYTVQGLNPSSTYDFYVQTDCGGGDESYWGGPMTASTVCGATLAPFYEGFNTGELPHCWSNVSNDPSTSTNNFWLFDDQGDYGAANNGRTEGTFAKADGNSPYSDSMMLISTEIDISPLTNPALSFEWYSNNTNNPGDNVPLIVLVTKDNINWVTLDTLKGDNDEWQFASYDLNAFANETIRVIFMTNKAVTNSYSYYNDILIDEVRIDDCVNGQAGSKDVCRLDGTIDLNDNIIVPPNGGGKWYGGTGLDNLITNDSILSLSSLPAGSYDVYYSERTVCYDTTVATINIYGPSSAGDGNTINACKYAPLNLFSAITGNLDMGGDWYDYNGNLLPNSQPTSPGTQANYNYQYIVSNGVCPADTSTVEVVVGDCDWVSLDEEAFTNISVYPNPATNQINIMNPSNASDLKVKVLDMNGRVVLIDNDVMKNTSKATIAIDQLSKGIYTLRVYNNEGQKIFKVVKQ